MVNFYTTIEAGTA